MSPEILSSTFIVGGIGLFCGAALGLASRFFSVYEDPRISALVAFLPGANCCACGYAGCADYAKALVAGGAKANLCKPGGAESVGKIAALLGIEAVVGEREVAIVLCGGGDSVAAQKFRYNGVADCAAAVLVGGGFKACGYGCLGLGTCARVCPVGAIEITGDRLALVHPAICIGCGLCVPACPRQLIRLAPERRSLHVLCRSQDRGPVVKKCCSAGCIACTLCVKAADGVINMDGALAVVDYARPLENEAIIGKCPQHTIVKRAGVKGQPA